MVDFSKITTYPIKNRRNLVALSQFAKLTDESGFSHPFLACLADAMLRAKQNNSQIILMCGAHVVKTGQTPYIIDLMKKGLVTHVAVNGAFSIHDFEISLIGATSEDVAYGLKDGSFGMVEETGRYMNESIKQCPNLGYGKAIGKKIDELNNPYKEYSVLWNAFKLNIPATVHVAIGTDIIHQHPSCDGSALGSASFADFKIFTDSISRLSNGVCLNIGSAVILPEVFLKALTIAQNLNRNVTNITAAIFDQIDHYRPRTNVVQRPVQVFGGESYIIIAKHQESIPALYHMIIQKSGDA